MKIEEERPEVKPESEQKVADNSSIIRHPNYEYPMIWLPSSNMNDKENGRSVELPPQFFNGWVPVNGKRTGHVKQQEQDNQKAKPIIWMPAGYDEPKQEAKQLEETDENPRVPKEAPPSPNIKIMPLSWFGNDHHDQKPAAKDGSGDQNDRSAVKSQYAITEHQDGRAMEGNYKTTLVPKKESEEKKPVRENYKTIPVLPKNDSDEKKPVGGNYRTIPVVSMRESDDDKPDVSAKKAEKKGSGTDREGENGKRNNGKPSKAKHSKLPPVCLRVDPLPREKPGNGSSRSPSTPTRKDADKAKKDVKEAQSQNQEPKQPESKKDITVSDVKEKSPDEMKKVVELSNGTVQATSVKHAEEEEVPTSVDDQKVQGSSNNVDAQEIAGEKSMQGCAKSTREDEIKIQGEAAKDDARTRRINFSEPDAALRIQSAYRGYHVRRWQPLEKLRKIKNVHDQMEDVKKQLQDLEASSKPTEKEQMAISETIMNLLLNLDTIQGLHSSVREARKSIARELICLQEKLDSLCKQLSGEPNHTIGEEEKPEGVDTLIQTTASVSTAEASEEETSAGVGEGQKLSSVDSKELVNDAVSSGVSVELRQDADSTEHKHQMEESTTTKEEAADEGEAATQGECQGASSMDVMNYAALSRHSTEQKHQSNTIPREGSPEEEKAAAKGEGQEVSSVGYMEQLHDAALSEDSNVLKQCTDSTEHNGHTEESHTWVSPAATEDSTAALATASLDGSVEGQVLESAAVESSELKHDVAPAEEDQCKEPSASFVHLEDSSVSLKDAELHEHDPAPADDSTVSSQENLPEKTTEANVQQQVADTTQDSNKQPDGTPGPSVGDANNVDYVTAADAEKSAQSP